MVLHNYFSCLFLFGKYFVVMIKTFWRKDALPCHMFVENFTFCDDISIPIREKCD